VTLNAVHSRDATALIKALDAERLAFLKTLKTWPVFGKGWGARVASVDAIALRMAAEGSAAPRPISAPLLDTGKGVVPLPAAAQKLVATAGGGMTASPATFLDWAHGHPIETAALMAAGLVVIVGGLYLVGRWHQAQQYAVTPGFAPVSVH
jgi:lysozyme family protein